jgi:hypothetical protein
MKDQVMQRASVLASSATHLAGNVLARIKQGATAPGGGGGFNPLRSFSSASRDETEEAEDVQPVATTVTTSTASGGQRLCPLPSSSDSSSAAPNEEPSTGDDPSGPAGPAPSPPDEDEWVQADGLETNADVTDGVSAFSIVDDDHNL